MWAALFPGQGSQHQGMGKFLFDEFSVARATFEEAGDTLGIDFKKLCFEGSEADLSLTQNTQPALLLVSTATHRVLESVAPFKPLCAAGHSVGEYAALVASKSLSFPSALKAVRQRGQLMQSAVPVGEGGMVAVMGLSPKEVDKLCRWTEAQSGEKPLEPANYNAPGQVVISGSQKAIDWLNANFDAETALGEPKKVRMIPLKVSAPFHCSLMKPAEEKMREVLKAMEFSFSQFPVLQNVVAAPVEDPESLRENLILQMSGAVRWVECVEKMAEMGARRLIEMGSGKVLAGLVKKIDSERLETFNINSLDELKAIEKQLTA